MEDNYCFSIRVAKKTSSDTFTTLVKVDHIIYKDRAYTAIMHQDEKVAAAFLDHHHCRLGDWYYNGMGKELFAHTTAYRMLKSPHMMVHNINCDVIKKIRVDKWNSYICIIKYILSSRFSFYNNATKMQRC
jgi:Chemoreceptor zinc-binding domain